MVSGDQTTKVTIWFVFDQTQMLVVAFVCWDVQSKLEDPQDQFLETRTDHIPQ